LIGICVAVTASHSAQRLSFGYTVNGNNLARNYYGGLLVILASGVNVTGNTVSSCGQGGTDALTYTVEPGVMADITNPGTGYTAGDVLTLSGGTGTAAKVAVLRTGAGGSLVPGGQAILFPGAYTVFPANPVAVTGGSGSGAKLILTGTSILTGGTLYFSGQVLVANVGTFYNPMRVLISGVDGGGAVTAYQVLDGGGYFGILPSPLTFSNDAYSGPGGIISTADPDVVAPGNGFTLLPSFGLRYSQNMNGRVSFGISLVGPVNGAVLGSNVIDTVRTGAGILIRDDVAPYAGRATWLCVTGNSIINNLYGIKGATGYTLDDVLDPSSVFTPNIIYP
jgi:hypothetical protein